LRLCRRVSNNTIPRMPQRKISRVQRDSGHSAELFRDHIRGRVAS
jgi:hypothetical protein